MTTEHSDQIAPIEPQEVLAEDPSGAPSDLRALTAEQDAQAQKYAIDFLAKVIRIRGVNISRKDYLRQELRKLGVSDAQISKATDSTPLNAGIPLNRLDELAASTIAFETRKSATMSFAAGLPGGFAMFASVPADIMQYYVHALRIIQKLAYLYGWQDLLSDLDEADDETIGRLALFFGVMMGVGGAATSLTAFASQVARPAIHKQIAKQTLTKTAWYGPMKKVLSLIGVKVTKDSFAKTVTKAVPVVGGVISGTMTLVALKGQSVRLLEYLRETPPPGVDAAEHAAILAEAGSLEQMPTIRELTRSATAGLADVSASAADAVSTAAASTGEAAKKLASGLRNRFSKVKDSGRAEDSAPMQDDAESADESDSPASI